MPFDRLEYNRAYYAANREEILAKSQQERPLKREQKNARLRREYHKKVNNDPGFRERENARKRAGRQAKRQDLTWVKRRRARALADYYKRKIDPAYRIEMTLRNRIRNALKGKNKSAKTMELLECTIEFFRAHLESLFLSGMTWENYGSVWHVDHILPCAKFHLQHSEEQEICFNWSNLQPLFAKDNISKADKIL